MFKSLKVLEEVVVRGSLNTVPGPASRAFGPFGPYLLLKGFVQASFGNLLGQNDLSHV